MGRGEGERWGVRREVEDGEYVHYMSIYVCTVTVCAYVLYLRTYVQVHILEEHS